MPSQLSWTLSFTALIIVYMIVALAIHAFKIEWYRNGYFSIFMGVGALLLLAANQLSLSKKDVMEEEEIMYKHAA